jgi:hypothetical protein
MKNKFALPLLLILLMTFIFSCQQELVPADGTGDDSRAVLEAADPADPVDSAGPVTKLIKDRGVIRYIDLEGGFYGIIGRNGKYDPINLPKAFQQDGLQVQLVAKVCNDMASFHMWGILVELISLKTIGSQRQLIMDSGVVHQYAIQGGPWVIEASTGSYQVLNLPREYMREGLKVKFVGIIRKDIVIIPALWPLMELLEITPIGTVPQLVKLNQPFKLQVTKSALEPTSGVQLTFKSVLGDSRCPTGVVCVWQGEAVVEVNIKVNGKDYGDFKMSTYNATLIDLGNYYVQFRNLYPYPAINIRIDPSQYVGEFVIGTYLRKEAL